MPIYVMLTTLTETGRKTIKDEPDRIKEVNKEVEGMGIKILSQYALFGLYDFVNILEAPSDVAVAKLAINLGARGTIQTCTLPAMTVDNLIATLKKKSPKFTSPVGAEISREWCCQKPPRGDKYDSGCHRPAPWRRR